MGRVYAVASGKGGVGKTTTTVNLGAALAAAGHEVAVVDADLGMANVAGAFGVEPSGATVHDVLAGEASVADATYEGAGGVSVLPGSDDVTAFARSDPEGLDDLLDALSAYDFVLLDTGASLTHVTVRPLALADEVLLVSTTERAALGDTDRTRQVTNRVGGSVVGAVLTRVDPANPNAEEVSATLDAKVLEVVPEDPTVGASMAAGEPLELHAPGSQAAAAYRRLAALLSGDAERQPDAASASESESESESGTGAGAEAETQSAPASATGEADESVAEDEDVAREDPDEASAGVDDGSADAGETAGLSDALASAETSVADADATPSETRGGSDERASDSDATDAGVSESPRDGSAEAPDEAGADETSDESTVSETVLADEFARGLVAEAEPGDADGSADARTAESGIAGADPSAGGVADVPDAESNAADEDGEDDADEDGDGGGFFRRLLG